MNRTFHKFTQKTSLIVALLGMAGLCISTVQAEPIFEPLPTGQVRGLPQNQLVNTIETPVAIELNPAVNANQTVASVPNGQEYYTLPNEPEASETLPIPEPNTVLFDTQPTIVPFPNQPLETTSKPITATNTPANIPATSKRIPQKTAKKVVKPEQRQIITQSNPVMPEKQPAKEGKHQPVKEQVVPMVNKANLKFANFPAKVYTGKRVTPKIATLKNLNGFYVEALRGAKGEKQFIATLNSTKPNYAGHYVITSFTCGLNCSASVAYDIKTGEFIELGGGFADCPATDFNPRQKVSVTHHVSSRLLIVLGSSSSGSCVAGYFEEKNGNVNLISQKNLLNYVPIK